MGLSWSEPEEDGGCEVTGYIVEKREAVKRSWTVAGKTEEEELKATG